MINYWKKKGIDALEKLKLVRVREGFRVIAVGVPSPPFPGNPLDPPLRSRFQARHVRRATTQSLLLALRIHYAPSVHSNVLEELLSIYESLWALGDTQASTSEMESKALAFSASAIHVNSQSFPREYYWSIFRTLLF